ncbi:MAG: arginine--tRNA ligase [Candidatus Omnitrophica bacterium]|nr:arginine--tRNA ligase [Candidatus Omnitrophota bacterium]
MRGFYQKFSEILNDIIKNNYEVELGPPLWEVSACKEFGDLSSMVALRLASKFKKEPLEIATDLKLKLVNYFKDEVEKIEIIKPGFINIFVSKKALLDSLNTLIKEKENFFKNNFKERVLLEFVSANPTGPLSVAHGRQAVVGDVIANILKFYGNIVEKEYYINDYGKQIEVLISTVKERIKEIKGEDFCISQDAYLGEYVKDIAKTYLEKRETTDLENFVIDYILSWIKKDLKALDIEFDNWISQKKLINDGYVEKTISFLNEKGLIYENEGSKWFCSTKFGDDKDRVVIKSDKELTYFACDIAYHKNKLERNYQKLINLWGPDHHGYIKRVKSAIEALGYDKEILKIIIIQLVTLKTKEKMSKRKGKVIFLSDLVQRIGKDATRFYYLLRKNSSHLEFDTQLAQEASFNNALYYIQYANARIESIFKKAKLNGKDIDVTFTKYLDQEEEINYLRILLQFSNCLDKAYYTLEPVFIIEFLKTLATNFHKFYERNKVLCEDKNKTYARLTLLEATRIVLHCALKILGIKPVEKM